MRAAREAMAPSIAPKQAQVHHNVVKIGRNSGAGEYLFLLACINKCHVDCAKLERIELHITTEDHFRGIRATIAETELEEKAI